MPWERNEVLGLCTTATGDVELSTRQVKLRATSATCRMEGNMFVSHQIFAGRDTLWKLDVVVGSTCRSVSI
jgi:hypothetical protein